MIRRSIHGLMGGPSENRIIVHHEEDVIDEDIEMDSHTSIFSDHSQQSLNDHDNNDFGDIVEDSDLDDACLGGDYALSDFAKDLHTYLPRARSASNCDATLMDSKTEESMEVVQTEEKKKDNKEKAKELYEVAVKVIDVLNKILIPELLQTTYSNLAAAFIAVSH